MKSSRACCTWLVVVCSAVLMAGCGGGGDIGEVEGLVTLDGNPLPNAEVLFYPTEGGRPSSAVTDGNGRYVLQYTLKVEGAQVGKHRVEVRTGKEEDGTILQKEKVPIQFNLESELKKEVKSGENEINLELTARGQIVQPGSRGRIRRPRSEDCGGCDEELGDW